MIQGAMLPAAFWSSQDVISSVSTTSQISGYVVLTRVKQAVTICILQPFSPLLFARGPPKGPDRLIRKLSGQSTAENVREEWRRDVT